jgi:NAD(P)-dependent dehydrogenase (short-subunit alcohol dehydrogenase family)
MRNTVLITGANRGIGLEIARQLRARDDQVIAVCRKSSAALEELGCRVISGIDVANDDTVNRLAHALEGTAIDVVVNNAGILEPDSLETIDFDSLRRQFEVNTLGALRVALATLPNLREGGKLVIITSRVGSLADNGSGRYYGYRSSKTAVNMIGVNLALDLRERGIAVLLLHPGMVATDMTGHSGIPVAQSAAGLIERIDSLGLAETGSFWHADGEPLPW